MTFQFMMVLVHYNGHIIIDELISSQFISAVTRYLKEVNNCMTLTTLKQIILNLFIPFNGKSYTVDLFYRCPIMNGL